MASEVIKRCRFLVARPECRFLADVSFVVRLVRDCADFVIGTLRRVRGFSFICSHPMRNVIHV